MQKVLKYMYLFFTVSAKKTVFAVRGGGQNFADMPETNR